MPNVCRVSFVAFVLLQLVARAHADEDHARGPRFDVVTYNLDDGPNLVAFTTVKTFEQFVEQVLIAVQQLKDTSFPVRAKTLAREIAAQRPDVVGLQEVALWNVQSTPGCPASVDQDFLNILLTELNSISTVQYEAVVINDETEIDTTVPVPVAGSAAPCLLAVSFKDRDVILARRDPRLRVTNARKEHFHNVVSFTTDFGATLTLVRGWASVDVRRGTAFFRFIDTHLEAVSDVYRDAQAAELLLGPALTLLPLIVVGDFNFDPRSLPYDGFRHFGFHDVWQELFPRSAGFTCCQDDSLANPISKLDQRIDLVWTRGLFTPQDAVVIGDERIPMATTPPLWPSDHAGVAATVEQRALHLAARR